MQLETGRERSAKDWRSKLPPLWTVGPVLYLAGVILALLTGNLERFLLDYPWASFIVAYMIGSGPGSRFGEMHMRCTHSIRKAFAVSDAEFEEILEGNMRRLTHPRNLLFGLIFVPALLWAWLLRLWWHDYNSPILFDVYYLVVAFWVFTAYAAIMFSAVVACHLNIHRLCEKTPIDAEYLMEEGYLILRPSWGSLIVRVTVVAFIMSALINVPILLHSGALGSFLNLALAFALSVIIFLLPHHMFHRMLQNAKDKMLSQVKGYREGLGVVGLRQFGSIDDDTKMSKMVNSIYLTQYEWMLQNRSTWLVDLKAVTELLAVASMHVLLMEVLTLIPH
ncbi:MAG: hypothetical protein ACFFCK_08310 [Promethearchaeota archaeon]